MLVSSRVEEGTGVVGIVTLIVYFVFMSG